jgi:hypothetical protein
MVVIVGGIETTCRLSHNPTRRSTAWVPTWGLRPEPLTWPGASPAPRKTAAITLASMRGRLRSVLIGVTSPRRARTTAGTLSSVVTPTPDSGPWASPCLLYVSSSTCPARSGRDIVIHPEPAKSRTK